VNPQQAKELIHFHKTHKHLRSIGDGSDYFGLDIVHIHTQWVRDIFRRIGYQCVAEIYKENSQIVYPEMTSINEWPIGGTQEPHLDTYSRWEIEDENLDQQPSREWTLILTLNDNYGDGETYFPEHGYTHSPSACEGILFQGIYHYHGVNAVRRCSRHTIAMWFTSNPDNLLIDDRTKVLQDSSYTLKNKLK
jgi:hypothetical protein